MPNERNTENIVRDHFKGDPLFSVIKWEEQKSMNKRVVEMLIWASKWGKWVGKPEFLVTFPSGNMDYLIVIECKAKVSDHTEKDGKWDTAKYAVEWALHYAERLSPQYDVIAIAVSGETENELVVNNFHWKKWAKAIEKLSDTRLLSINNYLKIFANEQFAENLKNTDIIKKAIELNNEYHSYSIAETTRCTIVSAILLALSNDAFRLSYGTYQDSSDICRSILSAIDSSLKNNAVKNREAMIGEYSKIFNEPLFTQPEIQNTKKKIRQKTVEVVKEMIRYLHMNVYPLIEMEQSGLDVLGRFYTEFIRYAGGEGAQWLVLTPAHITDLFCDLANVDKDSIVYDPCCGTGGFLIAAMKRMFTDAGNDREKIENIRAHQLIGVELRPSMFTYACSNMMMRWDGKSNIYCGDCFPYEDIVRDIHHPTVAFLNPPYDVGNAGQVDFIHHALSVVAPQKGIVVAIVQMSVGIKNEKDLIAAKARVLSKHRLLAVLSMPDELFNPAASVPTCIMVFKAGERHDWRKTWFGYFKDDGLEKRKHKGRVDARGKWNDIRKSWVDAYRNSDEVSGLSVKAVVWAEDEWCAEAYMETSYDWIYLEDFRKKIFQYASFQVSEKNLWFIAELVWHKGDMNWSNLLDTKAWKRFRYDQIFIIEKWFYNKKPVEAENGEVLFIWATENNNGITSRHDLEDVESSSKDGSDKNHAISEKMYLWNCITVSNNGSVGNAFYQDKEFTCSHDINVLRPIVGLWNRYSALFLCTLIEKEKYRWAYWRKWRPKRMPKSIINLPVNSLWEPDWLWMEQFIKSINYL